jgi:sulfate adenylyltransferase subunit 2
MPATRSERPAPSVLQRLDELLIAANSERHGRVIEPDSSGSMEKKKHEGYF